MGPTKKELRRPDLPQESDTDSDYSPKTVTKKKKQSRNTDSPAASDTDSGRRKRKRNPVEDVEEDESNDDSKKIRTQYEEPMSYSDIICQTHKLANIDVEIPDDYLRDINYKQFNKLVRPQVTDANPKVSGLHVTSLVGAKWREFKELYGMDHRSEAPELDRVKQTAVPSPSASESEMKESAPASPDSLVINESGEGSDDEEYDDESSNDLKLKMIRRGNKIFRAGDRKTSRQSKKTARQGIVNLDEINLDDVTRADDQDDNSQDAKKKPIKKRTGPRIKNTKDKKEKKKAAAAAAAANAAAKSGKRGPYKKAMKSDESGKIKVVIQNDQLSNTLDAASQRLVTLMDSDFSTTLKDITEEQSVENVAEYSPTACCHIQGQLLQQELSNAQLRAETLQLERNLLMVQQETLHLNKQYIELKVENQILKNNKMKKNMYESPKAARTVETNVFTMLETHM